MADIGAECGRARLFHTLGLLGVATQTVPYYAPPRPPHMHGLFCKNLFLKDRKSQYYLVICNESCMVDLKLLRRLTNAHRNFSFASSEDLFSKLGTMPGCVTPFALLNDTDCSIKVVIDAEITQTSDFLNFHPMVAEETTLISFPDLKKFLAHCGHDVTAVDINQR